MSLRFEWDPKKAERNQTKLGHSEQHQLILVNFIGRDNRVRIFSARKVTRQERKDYEENVKS